MSDTTASLRRKIDMAGDLRSVVHAMKGLAAANIEQHRQSGLALGDYARTVELGLTVCFREGGHDAALGGASSGPSASSAVGAIVFGSDQGLVGQFNEVIATEALAALATRPGEHRVWAVGERVHTRLVEAGLQVEGLFAVPSSVSAITPLVGQLLVEGEARHSSGEIGELHLFYNRPTQGSGYEPARHRLLPLDDAWRIELAARPWPTKSLPEVPGYGTRTLQAFLDEYLFVSLFRACAESLASENASRLAAMQRAEKNIDDLLETLNRTFHRVRQSGIDEELFDVITGFEASQSGAAPGGS